MLLSFVVPCFNEVENVPKIQAEFLPVVTALLGCQLGDLPKIRRIELIFVDDGSSDGTLDALRSLFAGMDHTDLDLVFAKHEINRGLGAALRTGFGQAFGEVIVTTDSDGTYEFSTIPQLISCMKHNVDIVTASPYHRDGRVEDVPAYRIVLSRGSSLIYQALVDRNVRTYTCLFRAYRRTVIDAISFDDDGFLAGTELMVKAMQSGYRVAEYPAVLYSRVHGTSKAKLMRTIRAHVGFQVGVLRGRFQSTPSQTAQNPMRSGQ